MYLMEKTKYTFIFKKISENFVYNIHIYFMETFLHAFILAVLCA